MGTKILERVRFYKLACSFLIYFHTATEFKKKFQKNQYPNNMTVIIYV
jgi:hypothetical protein